MGVAADRALAAELGASGRTDILGGAIRGRLRRAAIPSRTTTRSLPQRIKPPQKQAAVHRRRREECSSVSGARRIPALCPLAREFNAVQRGISSWTADQEKLAYGGTGSGSTSVNGSDRRT